MEGENSKYIINIPISSGKVLIDFYSGNVLYLNRSSNEIKEKLEEFGFWRKNQEKVKELKNGWIEQYTKNNNPSIYIDLTTLDKKYKENVNRIIENLDSNLMMVNLGILLYGENNNLDILNLNFKNIIFQLRKKSKNINLSLFFMSLKDLTKNSTTIDNIIKLKSMTKDLQINISIIVAISNVKEFLFLTKIAQKFASEASILTTVIFCNNSKKAIKALSNVLWKYQLMALYKNIFLIPSINDIYKVFFSCTYKIDLKIFEEDLPLLFEDSMERVIKFLGGGVIKSIDYFISTNMYFPPSLKRCNAGNSFLLMNSKVYCCYKDYLNEDFIDLTADNVEELLLHKIDSYKKIHLLYSQEDSRDKIITYGGMCPHEDFESQKNNILSLLSIFFEAYISYKRS
ncbi:hypothetical protein [Petrotoga sp. HWHPT.55.6.3]|jgi:hypothetical protein|uniref:hypothetical protein n=1 Tax=Petrotoga sp. HWHPT.55.6.3 TaxID=1434330 RepID=UPI000CA08A57|nr:hypothetical protein [Petrotoga sp. HWHPT.55.6.3]PNR91736.1 hypothetical protein X926_08165 [Petrotoga sp. HWHPT.55.6.3]